MQEFLVQIPNRWELPGTPVAAAALSPTQAKQRLQVRCAGWMHITSPLRRTLQFRGLVGTSASLLVTSALLVGTRTLLGAPGIATRSKDATSSSWHRY